MDLATINAVREELVSELTGRPFGKVFQLSRTDIAVDLHLRDSRYLLISIEPGNPRAYLIRRRLRDLEKESGTPSGFSMLLRKRLSGAEVSVVEQADAERVLLISFDGTDELDRPTSHTLVLQLTGASANLFLLDASLRIVDSARDTLGDGQQIGDTYCPPERKRQQTSPPDASSPNTRGPSISEILDAEQLEKAAANRFKSLAAAARGKLKQERSKREKLIKKLNDDRTGHGDADKWKHFGDVLLANSTTARREGGKVFVVDYFDEAAPEIAIEIDENDSVTEAAEKFFKRYTKARNAKLQIEKRLDEAAKELAAIARKSEELEKAVDAADEDAIRAFVGGDKSAAATKHGRKRDESPAGSRTFISSDGFEILVGKKAKDNDFLTFRVAKSLDTWMHAADYPGSHVVIRNPNRKEIPPKTLVEAAQLAAFYSQGKAQPKAAVHYTQKKFVNKPKGAAPGLVSLASFKTILVEPKIGEARLAE